MASTTGQQPTILLLSLDSLPFFDRMYSPLIDSISDHATIKRASNVGAAARYLTDNSPTAIIVTDAGITKRSNREALDKVKAYIANGGTAIFGCLFSSLISSEAMDKFWQSTFNLAWETGSDHRTTVHVNSQALSRLNTTSQHLESAYSQKAVFLNGVDRRDSLYLPTAESVTESHVFLPESVDTSETPVAWTTFSEGWIGYVGDVNAEAGSDKVILAMCGL